MNKIKFVIYLLAYILVFVLMVTFELKSVYIFLVGIFFMTHLFYTIANLGISKISKKRMGK